MKIEQTIGLIGAGNMGAAILEGLLGRELVAPSQVWIFDKVPGRLEAFCEKWKVRRAASVAELVRSVQIVLLAVKPQDLGAVAEESRPVFGKGHLLVSILAGVPIARLRQQLGESLEVVRAMPNLCAKVGQSMTALAGLNKKALTIAGEIFSGCGVTVELEEDLFDLVTAVSGSGPAYFFLMMELLAREGVSRGLETGKAEFLAVQTALGAAELAKNSSASPAELRAMVTSKGGTTEAALKILEEKGFAKLFHEAVEAAVRRSKELGQN